MSPEPIPAQLEELSSQDGIQVQAASSDRVLQRHMPQLDVLRGIAVALVVLYHGFYDTSSSQPDVLADVFTRLTVFGWLGVNLFFTLSGFLITGNLLDTKEKPGYYRKFYVRRALRIAPALLLILFVLVLLRKISLGGTILSIAFLANYPQLIPSATYYGPLWSLSVEEQFYILWPILVLHVTRRRLAQIAVALCIAEPLLRGLLLLHGYTPDLIHRATFLIADNLALGALAAIFVRTRFGTRANTARLAVMGLILGIAILLAGIPFHLLHRTNAVGAALQIEPFEIIFTAILLGSLTLHASHFSTSLLAPLRWLGNISYGLYLVHPLIFKEFDIHTRLAGTYYSHFGKELLRFCVCTLLSLIAAALSRRFFEEPFLRLKSRLAP